MKKIIALNIAGSIINVEEDAYPKLKSYLEKITRYFSSYEDSHEIIKDIESRIAEILLGKLHQQKAAVSIEDINELIKSMGSVEDFMTEETFDYTDYTTQEEHTTKQTEIPITKRLFRDNKRKIIAGVASGFAHYFKIDPVWVRLVLLLLFLMKGIGLIAYLLCWIAIPKSDNLGSTGTRLLMRDKDNAALGGVAAGMSLYLGIDLAIIRICFLTFTLLGGSGIFIYLILWFITPQATTVTDKINMQGDPMTLQNIENWLKKDPDEKTEPESTFMRLVLTPIRFFSKHLERMNISHPHATALIIVILLACIITVVSNPRDFSLVYLNFTGEPFYWLNYPSGIFYTLLLYSFPILIGISFMIRLLKGRRIVDGKLILLCFVIWITVISILSFT